MALCFNPGMFQYLMGFPVVTLIEQTDTLLGQFRQRLLAAGSQGGIVILIPYPCMTFDSIRQTGRHFIPTHHPGYPGGNGDSAPFSGHIFTNT